MRCYLLTLWKWRLLTKCLVFVAFGLTLLFVGYSVGLLTQFRRDVRFGGYCRIYDKVFLDKQLSTGTFDIALKRLEDNLDSDVAATNYSPTLADLPRLLRGTVFEHTQFNDDWRNKAIAMAAGFHRTGRTYSFPRRWRNNWIPSCQTTRSCG